MQKEGMAANVIIYSALISACEKGEQAKQALTLFEAMKRQGVVPNLEIY